MHNSNAVSATYGSHQDGGQGVKLFNLNPYSKLLTRKRKRGNVQWRRVLHDQHEINFYF